MKDTMSITLIFKVKCSQTENIRPLHFIVCKLYFSIYKENPQFNCSLDWTRFYQMACRGAGPFLSRLIFTCGTPRPFRSLSCINAIPSCVRVTHDSPVRAPPRLPRRSCCPSSLSCLLNFSDFPGPEATSGLLHFRHGMGGGDNMWSSCREKD